MAAPVCPVLIRRIRTFSRAVGLATLVASLLALAAWPRFPEVLIFLFPRFNTLNALSIALAGLSLYLSQSASPFRLALSRACASTSLAYGVVCMFFNLFPREGGPLSIEHLPSMQSSVTFVLSGLALLTLDLRTRHGHWPSGAFGLAALMLPYLALIGYAYQLGLGTPLRPYRGMSAVTALILILLAVGTLCARPERGVMARLTSNSLGGSILRRLGPGAFWAPLILGLLRQAGEKAGLFDPQMGSALVTLTMGLVGLGLVLWNVDMLNRTEAERERIAAALKASEARYRLLADFSSDMLSLHSLEGTYLYASPASSTVLGYPPEELQGRSAFDFILAADRPMVEATRRQLLEVPGQATVRYRVRSKDGQVRWIESTARDVPSELSGQVEAMLVVSRDVTARVEAEKALRESEERYRRLVELSPEAIFVARQGQIRFVNPAGAHLLAARDAAELIGRSLIDFVHPDSRATFQEQTSRAQAEQRATVMFEKKMVRLDGSTVDVESTASPISYGGEPAMIALSRDITERKKAMEEIAMRTAELRKASELDRLKDHFLSTLSHEMKTPLSLIVGYTELLEEKYPGEDLLKGVQDGARRLTDHIDSMLDYSALLSGTLPLYKTEVYLPEIVETATHITQAGRDAHAHQLVTRLEPGIPPIMADPRRLTQILVELLDNACKFMPSRGTIGIQARSLDGRIRLEVWDTGPGIPPEAIRRIWEPFAQLAIGNAGRLGGLGLGLTIARKLTELHGGTLEVSSEVGKGSRFTVELPIDEDPARSP